LVDKAETFIVSLRLYWVHLVRIALIIAASDPFAVRSSNVRGLVAFGPSDLVFKDGVEDLQLVVVKFEDHDFVAVRALNFYRFLFKITDTDLLGHVLERKRVVCPLLLARAAR